MSHGTVEIVREQVEQRDRPRIDHRRTAVLTGVGAAVAAAFPGLASGGRPATHRHDKKRLQDHHARVQGGFPPSSRSTRLRGDARHDPGGRLLRAGVDVRRALGNHMDAPGHFTPGRAAHGDHAGRADRPDRRDRHLAACRARAGHDGDRRRPPPVRAAPWEDSGGFDRLHGLRLGRQGRRSSRVQRRQPSRTTTSPASVRAAMWLAERLER